MGPMSTLAPRGSDRNKGVTGPAGEQDTARFASRMNASDALLWTIERDPCLRSTIVAISMLDRSPDWQRLRKRIADTCELIPRLRQRVIASPFGLVPPRWELDDYFDLDYHLRRTIAPEPGDYRSVLDIAGQMATDTFDKDRPLWEFLLVEGMKDGRAAFIQKVHHSFTDGVGGVKLAKLMFDEARKPAKRAAHTKAAPPPRIGGLTSAAEWFAGDVRRVAKVSMRGAQAFPGVAARMATTPGEPVITIARNLRSIGKLLAPVTTPLSPVMTKRGLSRRLDSFDVSVDDLLAAAHRADSSLNDAFLAGVAGGMRRYHERHDAPVEALRVTMPINLRRTDDPSGSNRFTPARFTLPVATVDAAKRMQSARRAGQELAGRAFIAAHRCHRRHAQLVAGAGDHIHLRLAAQGDRLRGHERARAEASGLSGRCRGGSRVRVCPAVGVGVQRGAHVARRHLLHRDQLRHVGDTRPGRVDGVPARGLRRSALASGARHESANGSARCALPPCGRWHQPHAHRFVLDLRRAVTFARRAHRLDREQAAVADRYRQKVRFVPGGLGHPVWVDDPHFHLDYHVRHSALPPPGTVQDLENLMGRLMSQELDRHRPLWEVWMIEGLPDDRWALITKVHHCMVDGISGTDLMAVLLDSDPLAPARESEPWTPAPEPSDLQLTLQALGSHRYSPDPRAPVRAIPPPPSTTDVGPAEGCL